MVRMSEKIYSNFVKATPEQTNLAKKLPLISGEDAKRMYLEEIKDAGTPIASSSCAEVQKVPSHREVNITDKELLLAAETNDLQTLQLAISSNPEKVNLTDNYGWTLLMIACQANSVDVVQELLRNNADTSIRDKSGNSAQSLVLKNRNSILAGILLDSKEMQIEIKRQMNKSKHKRPRSSRREYLCETCGKVYPNEEEHLTSTIHNINASKGKKITSSYKIPQTNKGFQIMLKNGWDRDSGLGADGHGIRYPIKTVQKKDRKGLGNEVKKKLPDKEDKSTGMKYQRDVSRRRHQQMEINFRRQFY